MKDYLNIGNEIKNNMPQEDSTFHSIKKTKLKEGQKLENVLSMYVL